MYIKVHRNIKNSVPDTLPFATLGLAIDIPLDSTQNGNLDLKF